MHRVVSFNLTLHKKEIQDTSILDLFAFIVPLWYTLSATWRMVTILLLLFIGSFATLKPKKSWIINKKSRTSLKAKSALIHGDIFAERKGAVAKILFVEDEELLQQLISAIFRKSEHEIIIAPDGLRALSLILKDCPDIIFSDIAMPLCDGFQLSAALEDDPRLVSIPLVYVTGFAQKYDIEEAARHRAAGYIVKPFKPDDLFMAIKNVLKAQNSEK